MLYIKLIKYVTFDIMIQFSVFLIVLVVHKEMVMAVMSLV